MIERARKGRLVVQGEIRVESICDYDASCCKTNLATPNAARDCVWVRKFVLSPRRRGKGASGAKMIRRACVLALAAARFYPTEWSNSDLGWTPPRWSSEASFVDGGRSVDTRAANSASGEAPSVPRGTPME